MVCTHLLVLVLPLTLPTQKFPMVQSCALQRMLLSPLKAPASRTTEVLPCGLPKTAAVAIRDGSYVSNGMGGYAVTASGASTLQVQGSTIANNTVESAGQMGGGLLALQGEIFGVGAGSVVVTDSLIINNVGTKGAGITALGHSIGHSIVRVVNSIVANNTGEASDLGGGGLYAADMATVFLENATFAGNDCRDDSIFDVCKGGGAAVSGNAVVQITNGSAFANNHATVGGGLYAEGSTACLHVYIYAHTICGVQLRK